jgi:two-component system, OmpR family, sensor histidine kinase MprB
MSLRLRIALAGALAVFAALLAASLVLYPVADHDLHDQLDGSLLATASTAPKLAQQLKQEVAASNGAMPNTSVLQVGGTLIQFVNGALAPGTPTELAPIAAQENDVASGALPGYFQSISYHGQSYRMYTAPYLINSGGVVRVARLESDAVTTLRRLRILLAALVLGGALAAALGARLLAGRVLRPVRALTDTVEQVAVTQDLSVRMDTRGRDEIGRLARSFTAMMSALDTSVQTQRRLVADASHELRTPLTSLTTNLELLAEQGGLADPQAPALLRAAREQSGELRVLINDLVDLARYGQSEAHCEDLRLDLLAADVVARSAERAPQLRFETRLDECFVHADPDAIERALANLVDNAVKWSPVDGVVHVSVSAEADAATFTVADRGPGIPQDDLPHVFDRFYRSVAARSKPGSGLGLSIVRQISDTHGGQVSAHPLPQGVEMRLTLPRVR